MQKSNSNSPRTFLVRFGALFLIFTAMCVMLVAFAPQPNPAALAALILVAAVSRSCPCATNGWWVMLLSHPWLWG